MFWYPLTQLALILYNAGLYFLSLKMDSLKSEIEAVHKILEIYLALALFSFSDCSLKSLNSFYLEI